MINLTSPDTIILKALLRTFAHGAEVWAYGSRATDEENADAYLDLILRNPAALDTPQAGIEELRGAIVESNLKVRARLLDWTSLPDDLRREITSCHVVVVPPISCFGTGAGDRDV